MVEDTGTCFVKIITSIMHFIVRDHRVLSRYVVRSFWKRDNIDKILKVFMSNCLIFERAADQCFLLTT